MPQAGVLPPKTLPIWLADPEMLTDSLAIICALRPLLQKVDAGFSKHLDEPATVDFVARTQLVLPILEAEQESWFDLVLVVDQGSSMHIWQRLVQDVVRVLRRYGAFRDVRAFDLVINQEASVPDDKVLLVSKPGRPGHRPSELIDQRGRRIVIILSDCAGQYWWNGTLLQALYDWGNVMPTAVWQMLPPATWERTALGEGVAVAISNDIPGGANQQLKTRIQGWDEPEDAEQRLPVPVITSEVDDLQRWSWMVVGSPAIVPGFLLPRLPKSDTKLSAEEQEQEQEYVKQLEEVPRSKTYQEIAEERARETADETDKKAFEEAVNRELKDLARERIEYFLDLASFPAQRLIMLLAAAPVLTLPVVRLIRDSMHIGPQSPFPLAEVFLSGLLQRIPEQEKVLEKLQQDDGTLVTETVLPELERAPEKGRLSTEDFVQYDFLPMVRSVLLDFLPEVDTIDVINQVSAAVERRWKKISKQDFRAFLTDPNVEVAGELEGLRSFASVTADILDTLSSEQYKGFVEKLRQRAEKPLSFNAWLADFSHERLTYSVAEYIDFPEVEPFSFEEGQLINEATDTLPTIPRTTLLITIDERTARADRYYIDGWLVPNPDAYKAVTGDGVRALSILGIARYRNISDDPTLYKGLTVEAIPDALAAFLDQAYTQTEETVFTIHVFLPQSLLSLPLEQMLVGNVALGVGQDCHFVVRRLMERLNMVERLRTDGSQTVSGSQNVSANLGLLSRWSLLQERLQYQSSEIFVRQPEGRTEAHVSSEQDPQLGMTLRTGFSEEKLAEVLENGIPLVLWSSSETIQNDWPRLIDERIFFRDNRRNPSESSGCTSSCCGRGRNFRIRSLSGHFVG